MTRLASDSTSMTKTSQGHAEVSNSQNGESPSVRHPYSKDTKLEGTNQLASDTTNEEKHHRNYTPNVNQSIKIIELAKTSEESFGIFSFSIESFFLWALIEDCLSSQ